MAVSLNRNLVIILAFSMISDLYAEVESNKEREEPGGRLINRLGRRDLMGFKETRNGGNITYDCSPSGPCVPCAYSEKNDEKYRCSETGYRIPLKCVDTASESKEANGKKAQKGRSALEAITSFTTQRRLLDEPSASEASGQAYITYRSCIPAVNEEKLSVLGFEGLMVGLLLASGSASYLRRKRVNVVPSGQVRVPNNSRF